MNTNNENAHEKLPVDVLKDVEIEEIERTVAPGLWTNSNETLVTDPEELELEIEELEPIVAPGLWQNSNETLATDSEQE
jgi:hypothetical protein